MHIASILLMYKLDFHNNKLISPLFINISLTLNKVNLVVQSEIEELKKFNPKWINHLRRVRILKFLW